MDNADTQIMLTLTANGALNVQASGPAGSNKLLLIGMLEMGKALLTKPEPTGAAVPPILLAQGSLPGHANGR